MSDTWAYDIARSIVEPNIEVLPDGRRVFVMLPQALVPIVAKEILKAFEKGQENSGETSDLKEALQLICVKCRSNCWGPETPRKDIRNNLHDIASYALAGNMEKAHELAKTEV